LHEGLKIQSFKKKKKKKKKKTEEEEGKKKKKKKKKKNRGEERNCPSAQKDACVWIGYRRSFSSDP
jgi:hypothetical protein